MSTGDLVGRLIFVLIGIAFESYIATLPVRPAMSFSETFCFLFFIMIIVLLIFCTIKYNIGLQKDEIDNETSRKNDIKRLNEIKEKCKSREIWILNWRDAMLDLTEEYKNNKEDKCIKFEYKESEQDYEKIYDYTQKVVKGSAYVWDRYTHDYHWVYDYDYIKHYKRFSYSPAKEFDTYKFSSFYDFRLWIIRNFEKKYNEIKEKNQIELNKIEKEMKSKVYNSSHNLKHEINDGFEYGIGAFVIISILVSLIIFIKGLNNGV